MMPRLVLPDRSRVFLTGETDPVLRHYQPLVSYFMNKRLTMALDLLGGRRFQRVLDAGYGGGIFLPELARRADELYGVDIHPHVSEVTRMAEGEGLSVRLKQASVCDTGFPDEFFDACVSVSVLEFVADVAGAIGELRRVTKPGGTLVLGFPGENVMTTAGYRLARTPDPDDVHHANYRDILNETARALRIVRVRRFPAAVPAWLALFFAVEAVRP